MAKLVTLIEVEQARGEGVEGDPVRMVRQWWTTSGDIVVEDDPIKRRTENLYCVNFAPVDSKQSRVFLRAKNATDAARAAKQLLPGGLLEECYPVDEPQ